MAVDKTISKDIERYNQAQKCTGKGALLGDLGDTESLAWLIQFGLNAIRVVGPVILIVLSSLDFAKVIINNDDEAMAKAQRKLIIRLVLVAFLFFVPLLVTFALKQFNLVSDNCGFK
jgi:hypothetical protein